MDLEQGIKQAAQECPICGTQGCSFEDKDSVHKVTCQRCGVYWGPWDQLEALPNVLAGFSLKQRFGVSSWLMEHPETHLADVDVIDLCRVPYPHVGERAIKLLKHLAATERRMGEVRELVFGGETDFDLLAASWSTGMEELQFLLSDYLMQEKAWLNAPNAVPFGHWPSFAISGKGYDFLDSLRLKESISTIGFCAMWFGEEMGSVWKDAISPAIGDAGYTPCRIDEVQHVNRIDDEIMAQIRRSKFVIADFTGQRGGVYFEAGYALGLGLPVIWTVRSDALDQTHFDNRQYNFLKWEPSDLPAFRRALEARIVAILGQGPVVEA